MKRLYALSALLLSAALPVSAAQASSVLPGKPFLREQKPLLVSGFLHLHACVDRREIPSELVKLIDDYTSLVWDGEKVTIWPDLFCWLEEEVKSQRRDEYIRRLRKNPQVNARWGMYSTAGKAKVVPYQWHNHCRMLAAGIESLKVNMDESKGLVVPPVDRGSGEWRAALAGELQVPFRTLEDAERRVHLEEGLRKEILAAWYVMLIEARRSLPEAEQSSSQLITKVVENFFSYTQPLEKLSRMGQGYGLLKASNIKPF